MTRRLVIAMTLVAAAVALALAIPLLLIVASDQRAAFVSGLEVEALATASVLSSQPLADWPATAEREAASTGARVVVVDTSRRLVADSDNSGLDRSFDRPEIDSALAGSLTSDVRYSQTLGTDLRYVAAPVVKDDAVVAAVRLSIAESAVQQAVQRTLTGLTAFIVAVVLGAGVIAWLLARSIAAPLKELAGVAQVLPDDLAQRADEASGPAEVREVAAALNTTAARLDDLVRHAQQVAADASHHLRTPLTGVRLRLEAIEDTATDPQIVAQAVAATSEVDRLGRRIDQVLALARADAGSGAREVVDVSEVAADRVVAAEPLASERGVRVDDRLEPGLPVSTLPGTVPRCLDELLGNALAYARAQVRVSTGGREGRVWLLVEDDGPGVPEEELGGLFERFSRGTGAVAGGSGLGMALVREVAEASGGGARAFRSTLGGLAVEVSWPALAGAEEPGFSQ